MTTQEKLSPGDKVARKHSGGSTTPGSPLRIWASSRITLPVFVAVRTNAIGTPATGRSSVVCSSPMSGVGTNRTEVLAESPTVAPVGLVAVTEALLTTSPAARSTSDGTYSTAHDVDSAGASATGSHVPTTTAPGRSATIVTSLSVTLPVFVAVTTNGVGRPSRTGPSATFSTSTAGLRTAVARVESVSVITLPAPSRPEAVAEWIASPASTSLC